MQLNELNDCDIEPDLERDMERGLGSFVRKGGIRSLRYKLLPQVIFA